ncbi:tryptophan synthase subunit alpha [Paenibacillus sp.]|uniref:tryptophan synthase subunit alpha n=1 Tax=Paenibacillus sp. TaxID=58172 RepID=UPI002D2494A5|nr:tryptophan synthase subunit alpha [Paenibacillus sp.]HZG88071.1 tryptophan synthase subunit alpha [Paenibacillus sp.]
MSVTFRSEANEAAFRRAERRGEALLAGYLIATDPEPAASLDIVREAVVAGIDIVELGVPSARPHLDGDIIRRGHRRVRRRGDLTREALLAYWRDVRRAVDAPIWAMGYEADVVSSGLYRALLEERLVDGLLVPDCPLERLLPIEAEAAAHGADVVRFVSPAMPDEELARACRGAAVLYAQSYAGATGDPFAKVGRLDELCERVRRLAPGCKIVAGFGLRTPEKVRLAVESGFDGAVVGSVLVNRCENGERDYLYRLIAEMKMTTLRSGGV